MFKRVLLPQIIIILLICAISVGLKGEEKGLTEIQKLKAENFKLTTQLIACQNNQNQAVLKNAQAELVEDFRKTLGAKDEEVFDWNTLTFKSSK